MTQKDVATPETHLDDLDYEFTSRLRHGMVTKTTASPFASPPSQVCLVVLEFSRKEHGDENLVDGALNGDDGNQSEDSVGGIPELKEPQEFEETNHSDDGQNVSNGCHDSTKLDAAQIEHGAEEQGNDEQREEHSSVPGDGSDGDDGKTDQGAVAEITVGVRERLDEHVCDTEDNSHADRRENLRKQDRSPAGAGQVSRKLLRRVAESLLLVTGNHGPRQTAVPDPRVGVRARVTAGHPPKVLPVVNDEVGERELVRVEHEGGNAQCENGDPEVNEMGHPDGQGDEKEHQQRPHAKIDTGSSETRVENAEVHAGRREASAGGDITSTTKGQIAQDRMSVDLSGEDLKDG